MAPPAGPHGHSPSLHQRPQYVPSSAVDNGAGRVTPTPYRSKPFQTTAHFNGTPSASSSLSTPLSARSQTKHTPAGTAASRLSQISPSAYDRFDEVSWIVDLSSRIGNALQSPSYDPAQRELLSTSAATSPSSSTSQAHPRARTRVRLPRPSREFRELQQKLSSQHGSTSIGSDADASFDITASNQAHGHDSAIQWAQHAQDDFERRRAELHQSRQAVLKHLEADLQDVQNTADTKTVDPAVERSLLAAKSLQELMRSGGLQSENADQEPGFDDLLANAEPLPGSSADIGPSSLFEAHRTADGTLDIESILKQRARMAAAEDDHQAAPSQPKQSILDVSQRTVKPAKRPVIEVLGADEDEPHLKTYKRLVDQDSDDEASQATEKEVDASEESSSASSSNESGKSSEADSADSDSDSGSGSDREQHAVPHPMDQIAIVDGAFRIIPAHTDATSQQQRQQEEESSGGDAMEDEDKEEDEDGVSASEAEEAEDTDNSAEPSYANLHQQQRYHDEFGSASIRDLILDGPTGDADEPIVLSDSDEEEQAEQEERTDVEGDEDEDEEERVEDHAMDGNVQNELANESSDEDNSVEHRPESVDADEEEQTRIPAAAQQGEPASQVADQVQSGGYLDGSEGDGVPDSEVEPEELDEDLRWSDINAAQTAGDNTVPSQQVPSPADAAFHAIHGSRSTPGFVTASQLLADIQAAATNANAAVADRTEDNVDQSVQPIDPQLLASLAGADQGLDQSRVPGIAPTPADESQPPEPEPLASQQEFDVFDAYTREEGTGSQSEENTSLQAQEDEDEGPQIEVSDVGERIASVEDIQGSPKRTELEVGAFYQDHAASLEAAQARIATEEAEDAIEIDDDDDDEYARTESIKPVLMRIENTDVLEADVEDNSEEDAANAEVIVESVGESTVNAISSPSFAELEDVAAELDDNKDDVEATGDQPALVQAEQRRSVAPVLEDEGVLSSDLADRDTSVEPSAVPLKLQPSHRDSKFQDAVLANELSEQEGDSDQDKAPGDISKHETQMKVEELLTTHDAQHASPAESEQIKVSEQQEAGKRFVPAQIETKIPNISQPIHQREGAEPPLSAAATSTSSHRVPPSPASSDRRSVSSFTPSANRQGHRHLHGATKRNLFAQMTEAASNFASNLTAPLRNLPSLLPICENQAEEKQEEDEQTAHTSAAARNADVEDASQESTEPKGTQKPEIKFTMNTRSHCLYRHLELTSVPGSPVFIVPGCSIDHITAKDEKARDLGATSEQNSDNWVDVDPDLLPTDVHHILSRIVGLQILQEGIFAEPDSTAAQLLLTLDDLGMELSQSVDDEQRRAEWLQSTIDSQDQPEEARDAGDAHADHPSTPPRVTRQSSRHRRTSSAASASSQHRSPRHPDPLSPNADYLPEDERKTLRRERHPMAEAAGDVSIVSLEGEVMDERIADDDAKAEEKVLLDTDHRADVTDAAPVSASPSSKKKRGRPRKSATDDMAFNPSANDQSGAGENVAEEPEQKKPKKGRGRKRAAAFEEQSTEAQAADAQDGQEAAAVEDAIELATLTPKRARRGRKSKGAATSRATEEQQGEENEGEDSRESGSPVRTRASRVAEGETPQQIDRVPAEDSSQEPKEDTKTKKSAKGNRKRKAASDAASIAAEASPAGKGSTTEEMEVEKEPRRSRRSLGGAKGHSANPSRTSPRKSPKRKVLKLN